MKNVIIIIMLITLVSCGDDSSNLCGDYLSIKLNECKNVEIGGEKATLKLVRIEDSRCPEDVVCIRAGEVLVDLKVNNNEVLNFCLGDCPERKKGFIQADTLAVTINNEEIEIVLKSCYSQQSAKGIIPPTACFEVLLKE